MSRDDFVLAQFNVARLKAPLDSPLLKEFVDFLAPVNRLAEESPGFIWRLTGDDGVSSSYLSSPYADVMVITNLTVWADIESLQNFTYDTVHSYFLRSRRKWFERMDSPHVVLWWIPRGHIPTLDEAKAKLDALEAHGPSPDAFALQSLFDSRGLPLRQAKQPKPVPSA